MFQQETAPVAGSLTLSALLALLPLITIFVVLGVFKTKAHTAGATQCAVPAVSLGPPRRVAPPPGPQQALSSTPLHPAVPGTSRPCTVASHPRAQGGSPSEGGTTACSQPSKPAPPR